MQRSKFPYTARSSAKVIRHAVSIDERRAKFRSDLISGDQLNKKAHRRGLHHQTSNYEPRKDKRSQNGSANGMPAKQQPDRFRRPSQQRQHETRDPALALRRATVDAGGFLMPMVRQPKDVPADSGVKFLNRTQNPDTSAIADDVSVHTGTSVTSFLPSLHADEEDELDETAEQDIEELWFPGCHADLGGGWPLAKGERYALSHGPLVWMVKEAERAGLQFDTETMLALRCHHEDDIGNASADHEAAPVPEVQVEPASPSDLHSPPSEQHTSGWQPGFDPENSRKKEFHDVLHTAATEGVLHDCLEFNNGLGHTSVLSWKMMEYLPFRRMDLKPDGSWAAISFPLPMGEVRLQVINQKTG